jgi:uncharacterized protein YPO0396
VTGALRRTLAAIETRIAVRAYAPRTRPPSERRHLGPADLVLVLPAALSVRYDEWVNEKKLCMTLKFTRPRLVQEGKPNANQVPSDID